MRRILSAGLVLGVVSLPLVGLVGCAEETQVTAEKSVETPGGSTTQTTTTEVEKTGDHQTGQ